MNYTYKTRYLGSKVKLLDWIWDTIQPHIEKQNIRSIGDIFAGTHSVSILFKQKGLEVICNDFLKFNYYIGKAVIENQVVKLTEDDIHELLHPVTSNQHFIENEFTDLFFPREDTVFLDNVHYHITNKLECPYKQALAFAAIAVAIIKRAPYGRFTTTKMSDLGRKTIPEYFEIAMRQFNGLVISKEGIYRAFHGDAIQLVKNIFVDAIYLDPPYGGRHYSKYEHYYNFVETFINYWSDEELLGRLKQVKKVHSLFSHGKNHKNAFDTLLSNAEHIPMWIFSYNNNGGLSKEDLLQIIQQYKQHVFIYETEYGYANKVSSFKEYLIVSY